MFFSAFYDVAEFKYDSIQIRCVNTYKIPGNAEVKTF